MAKTILVIAGAHGSGKTSCLGVLVGAWQNVGDVVDDGTILSVCGEDTTLRDRIMIERIRENCHNHELVLKMSLSSNIGLLKQELAYTLGKNYTLNLCYIGIDSLNDCLARVENRVQKDGRSVSAEEVKRCFDRRWDALVALIPYCNRKICFYDNNNGFQKMAAIKRNRSRCIPRKFRSGCKSLFNISMQRQR